MIMRSQIFFSSINLIIRLRRVGASPQGEFHIAGWIEEKNVP